MGYKEVAEEGRRRDGKENVREIVSMGNRCGGTEEHYEAQPL